MKNGSKRIACITKQHFAAVLVATLLTTMTSAIASAQISDGSAQRPNLHDLNRYFSPGGLSNLYSDESQRLPPGGFFTNCGPKCSTFSGTSGYYVSTQTSAVQTIAIQFTAGVAGPLHIVFTPNSCVVGTCNQAGQAKIRAQILKDCAGTPCPAVARTLTSIQTIPTFPGVTRIAYQYAPTTLILTAGTKYWLCERIGASFVPAKALWMQASPPDLAPGFVYNPVGSCATASTNWTSHPPSTPRPALAVY